MPKYKRATAHTVKDVAGKLFNLIKEEQDYDALKQWAIDLNAFLDGLLHQDAFGTEGQLDPRGDHRD